MNNENMDEFTLKRYNREESRTKLMASTIAIFLSFFSEVRKHCYKKKKRNLIVSFAACAYILADIGCCEFGFLF